MNTVNKTQPEITIVVPILNERVQLPLLLENLQQQQQVDYELLVVDGGSADGSLEWLAEHATAKVIHAKEPGRAGQLNLGASSATANWLLFLHGDSLFADPFALRKALDRLYQTGSQKVAGHFALKFRRQDVDPSPGYYFYEWKARLGRPETIHGDQGFLVSKSLFDKLGGFCEELRVMEDTDFAERLRENGQWCLLPAEVSTSARRFEIEGLWQRQLLGALIMCFRDIGWQQFFVEAQGVYRHQGEVDRLQLRPFFQLVRRLLREMGGSKAMRLWWQSGGYVRRHAWQLTFALDARREFRRAVPVGKGALRLTRFFEPVYNLITGNPLGQLAATVLLRVWFEMTDLWLRVNEGKARG